jgi:3-methylcrotonyl-CoA carboxylase alpha subunit
VGDGAHVVRCLERTPALGGVEELVLEVDGAICRALVARHPREVQVAIAGRVHRFETADGVREGGHAPAGSGLVTAPMPGKVVAVLVTVGDSVEAGQPLVVVEAMKMESPLLGELDGTVIAVHVAAGEMVDAGAVLIEIAAR